MYHKVVNVYEGAAVAYYCSSYRPTDKSDKTRHRLTNHANIPTHIKW